MSERHSFSILDVAGFPPTSRERRQEKPIEPSPTQKHATEPVAQCLALIATRNFIPFAQVTAETFLSFHPEFVVYLLLVDGTPQDVPLFTHGQVVLLSDLDLTGIGWYAAKFTASELSNALKPTFLRYLARFATKSVYLDCDIAVFSRLSEMIDLLETYDLVLVPHMLTPPPRPEHFWVHPTRADSFNAGLINAGSFAINLEKCGDFLDFWEEANLAPGAFYRDAGYQTDQQHLNWALVNVQNVYVLRSLRYNVAYWNLHERDLRFDAEGTPPGFHVGSSPLGFFHFSGYDISDRFRLSKHDGRHSIYNLPAVAALLTWYSDRVTACETAPLLEEPYRFDVLPNGFRLSPFIREILKKFETQLPRLSALTAREADDLCACLMEPLPATGSLLPLLAAEIYERRPDLQAAFPGGHTAAAPIALWRWFCRHAGVEYDVQFLVDRFRRAMVSDSIVSFAVHVSGLLAERALRFFGDDRILAASLLASAGHEPDAEALLEARHEWFFFSELGAAFEIYKRRDGLQASFPDILGSHHQSFCAWLCDHGAREHGLSPNVGVRFQRCNIASTLARIYSYVARREDVGRTCEQFLLLDQPEPLFRDLIRGAGDGLEYDLDDVITLAFIHETQRHLLVSLYLELPVVRRRPHASRIAELSLQLLPDAVRGADWARRGCEYHATTFDQFANLLDDEMARWAQQFAEPPRDVLSFLRRKERASARIELVRPAYRAAILRLPHHHRVQSAHWSRLRERELSPGVNVFGYFHSDIGVGESSRGLANAIARLRPVNRVPLQTSQVRDGTKLEDLFQQYDHLADTNVFVSYPHQHEDLLGQTPREYLTGSRNVVHLAWEQRDGNPWWKHVYDRYDEIWTISSFAASAFRKMFPDRVRVVPNVLDFESFPSCPIEGERLERDHVDFLFVFDANSSIERKNPEGVVAAFIKAFEGTRHAHRVRLTLKIGGMHRADHAPRLGKLMSRAASSKLSVQFDGRQLPRDEMLRLIGSADCYLSLHRAEGFGYTIAEAMSYGVPVIASGYSGNLEYMTPDDSFLVPCSETFVGAADGPFQRGSIWGEPDIEAAAALLREVVENPVRARTIGERGRRAVREKLSAEAVAETTRGYFEIVDHPAIQAAGE